MLTAMSTCNTGGLRTIRNLRPISRYNLGSGTK